MGRLAADRSVGGMISAEEAAAVGECSLPKADLGLLFEGNLDTLYMTSYTEMDLIDCDQS